MTPTALLHEMTEAMDRYDFPIARELALALRDHPDRDAGCPAGWTPVEIAERLKAVLARTVYPD